MFDSYGPESWFDLFSTFLPPEEPLPCAIDNEARQATWFVAALSASAGVDLRDRFTTEYGFPIDQAAWSSILGCVQARIDAREWEPPILGDLNCDGALNGADIDPFFLALGDPLLYAATFPECDIMNGDVNRDGAVNGADIDVFFECLGAGACP
jgi:hypothetical protein